MARGSGLVVNQTLWKQVPSRLQDPSDPRARRILVLAAYLDLLSADYGLSGHREPDLERRSAQPTPFLPFAHHYLAAPGGRIEPEDLRDRLYAAVAGLVRDSRDTQLYDIAQVYWALPRDADSRPDLRFRPGPRVSDTSRQGVATEVISEIWVEMAGVDLALLRRSDRTDAVAGLGMTSGSGMRRAGAALAVRLAEHLVDTLSEGPSISNARVHLDESGAATSITWEAAPERTRSASGIPATASLESLAREAELDGRHRDASDLLDVLVKFIHRLATSDPDQHEALSFAALRAGVAAVIAGTPDAAVEHLTTAQRTSQTLADLRPDEPSHRALAAMSLLMLSVVHHDAGRASAAAEAARDASAVAQQLADSGGGHDELLAFALLTLGLRQFEADQVDEATASFTRASTIATRLDVGASDDPTIPLALANALSALGLAHLDQERNGLAIEASGRAMAIVEPLTTSHPNDPAVRLVMAQCLLTEGVIAVFSDRPDQAQRALERVPLLLQETIDDPKAAPQAVAGAEKALAAFHEMFAEGPETASSD